MPFFTKDEMQWETVEVPFLGGVDLRQPARLVQPPMLTRAENVRFDTGRKGLVRRRGHLKSLVRTVDRLDVDQASGSYLFGVGVVGDSDADTAADGSSLPHTTTDGLASVSRSPGPDAGRLLGMAKRGDEVLAWDGWRLFSYPPGVDQGAWEAPIPAVMPTARSFTVAKEPTPQKIADACIASTIACVAWIEGSLAYFSIYDATTWAPLLLHQSAGAAVNVRCVPCGDWIHVLAANSGNVQLARSSVHRSLPSAVHTATMFDCDTYFDVKKVSEDEWLLATHANDLTVHIGRFRADGTTIVSTNQLADTHQVAVASHPVTGDIAVLYSLDSDNTELHAAFFSSSLTLVSGDLINNWVDLNKIAVEATYVPNAGDEESIFQVFIGWTEAPGIKTVTTFKTRISNLSASVNIRKMAVLCSHPWRVGDKVFAILGTGYLPVSRPLFQQAYYPCDDQLLPVGRLEYGTAVEPDYLFGVYFNPEQASRNRGRHHCVLVYRTRVDSPDNDQYDEESLKLCQFDFLPKLRSAQVGKCVYFPGAQLNLYDGRECAEAGIHHFPDQLILTGTGTGLPTGTYVYRMRWAYKNGQGEEIVSAETDSAEVVLANQKAQVVIPTLQFTRHSGVYGLMYRREATGTQWYLVSSRDPTDTGDNGFIANDPTQVTLTWTDAMSDADLISKELDTIGNTGELEPYGAPASEIIAQGRNRLWLAGGELPPGDVLPSKLYVTGRIAQFSQFLQTTVDRGADPVTSIAFMGNSTVVFKEPRVYAFEADGPNNLGQGEFDNPRVIVTDTGAVGPDATLLTTEGIWYQARSGIKLLATNYFVEDVGEPVFPEAVGADFAGAIMIEHDQEVRFYRTDGMALVYNSVAKGWTTWTGLESVGVVPYGDYVVLGNQAGHILVETEGLHQDGQVGYTGLIRTASLSRSLQGWQRARRFSLLGDFLGDHTLAVRVFYDDKDFPEDEFHWEVPGDDLNADAWGDGSWGDGVWGDTTADASLATISAVKTRVYEHRHRFSRQKCARLVMEIDDGGCHTAGAAWTSLAIELGARGGLARTPARSTT